MPTRRPRQITLTDVRNLGVRQSTLAAAGETRRPLKAADPTHPITEPVVSRDALEEYRAESNPAKTFLMEQCVSEPAAQVRTEQMYGAYVFWAKTHGFAVLAGPQFGKEVKKVFPSLRKIRITDDDGTRPWVYQGVTVQGMAVGLRLGEALAVGWEDVDLKVKMLRVRRSLQRIDRKLQFV